MPRFGKVSLVLLFVGLILAPAMYGQCTRSGTELVVDGSFVNNCSNWHYPSSSATRKTDNLICTGGPDYVKFDVGYGNEIYQDTVADAGGSNFTAKWTVQLANSSPTHSAEIYFNVIDINTGLVTNADDLGSTNGNFCVTHTINLGSHSAWVGHSLRIEIFSDIATGGGIFRVTGVSLKQTM